MSYSFFVPGVVRSFGIGIVVRERPVESTFVLVSSSNPSFYSNNLFRHEQINIHTKKFNNKNKKREPAPLPHDDAQPRGTRSTLSKTPLFYKRLVHRIRRRWL